METEDRQWLREFADRNSEAAFRALVDRHIGLVHAAARRQVGDEHLAEEVSQAVFVLLARKARQLSPAVSITGWLHRTTCFVARRARRSEERRRRRDQEAYAMQENPTGRAADEAWSRLAPQLDEALNRLGEADRQAILLRYFEARQHREVGAELGIGEEAAKKRVARALERLRALLAREGVVVPAAVLGTLLLERSVEAAPVGLAASLTATATGAGAAAAGAGVALPALVRETLLAARGVRLRWIGAAALGGVSIVLLLAGLVPGIRPGPAREAPTEPRGVLADADAVGAGESGGAPPAFARQVPVGDGSTLLFRVIEDTTGRGVAGGRLAIQSVTGGAWRHSLEVVTDAAGFAEIPHAPDVTRLEIGLLQPGWVARYATFLPHLDDAIPAEYTLRVQPARQSIGGVVRDEAGRPVEGAEILIGFDNGGDAANRETPRERIGCPIWNAPVARTDAEGRWEAAIVAEEAGGNPGFGLTLRHPEFADTSVGWAALGRRTGGVGREGEVAEVVEAALTTAVPGVVLAGRVMDGEGRPVVGARLAHGEDTFDPILLRTDAEGRFEFPRQPEGAFEFSVTAPGWAVESRRVVLGHGMGPVEVRLRPGALVVFRVVDEEERPVADAEVLLDRWGDRSSSVRWSARTGADGRVEWRSAPPGTELEFCARREGWCYTRDIKLTAGTDEQVIVLRPALRLSGLVTDARSGLPLAQFKAYPGYGDDVYRWERLATRPGTNGVLSVVFEERKDPWRVRIEAEGYESFTSEPLARDHTGPMDVALRRLNAGDAVNGIVLGPDGRPVEGAEVALLTLEHGVRLSGRGLARGGMGTWLARTDGAGRFPFPSGRQAHSVVAATPQGFAQVRGIGPGATVTLRLQAWGRIEGVVEESVRRRPVAEVWLQDPSEGRYSGCLRLDPARARKSADAEGRFVFEDVPPGEYVVMVNSGAGTQFHHRTPVRVEPGATAELRIGSIGPTLKGRLVLAGEAGGVGGGDTTERAAGSSSGRARRFQFAYLLGLDPTPPPPRPTDFEETRAAVDYWESPAGRAWALRGDNRSLPVSDADGTFVTEDEFRPGDYELSVGVAAGVRKLRVTIPAPAEGGTRVDLGELVLE